MSNRSPTLAARTRGLYLIISALLLILLYLGGNAVLKDDKREEIPLSEERILELRKTYPVYNDYGPLTDMMHPSFQKIVSLSTLYVVGEIIDQVEDASTSFMAEPGTPEYRVQQKSSKDGIVEPTIQHYKQYEIKVLRYLAGERTKDSIIVRLNAADVGYYPNLTPGLQLILPLGKGKGKHEGVFFTSKAGMFYIVDQKYVLSVMDILPSYQDYQGQPINVVIQEINRIKKGT